MPTTRSSKRQSIVPNGLSEEEVDSSNSEDEINKVRHVLPKNLLINKESSSTEEDDIEETKQASLQGGQIKKLKIRIFFFKIRIYQNFFSQNQK